MGFSLAICGISSVRACQFHSFGAMVSSQPRLTDSRSLGLLRICCSNSSHLGEIGTLAVGEASHPGAPELFHGANNYPMRNVPMSPEGFPATCHTQAHWRSPWQACADRSRKMRFPASVAILAHAISCSNVRMVFLRHELFWSECLQPSSGLCHLFSWLTRQFDDAVHTSVPGSPDLSSNFGSPDVSAPDLEKKTPVPAHWMRKSTKSSYNSRSYHHSHKVCPGSTRFESCVRTRSRSMATPKVTCIEQVVGGPAASVASTISSWVLALPGQNDGSSHWVP